MNVKRPVIILMLCSTAWLGCKNANETQCLAIPIAPQILAANVRIVDKTSGADLFLSPSSPYKVSDLQISSSLTGNSVHFFVDSAQKDIIIIGDNSQTFRLKLASLSADSINMSILVTPGRCYDYRSVNAITLDGTSVCSPCSYSQIVTIKK